MKNLKAKLSSGKAVFGLFLASGCTAAAELAGEAGYDFCVIDGEHGQCDERSCFDALARLEKYPAAGLVRIPAFRHEYVKRMLDYGADGILSPMIESEETAKVFADSMRYPPQGTRGMTGIFRASNYNGSFDEYYATANDTLLAAAQIESARGVNAVKQIAAVEGIDLLFIGHSDLTSDYGCYKQFSAPRIIDAEARIIDAARQNGKFVGMVLRPGMDLSDYLKRGVNFICLGTDLGFMRESFRKQLASMKERI